MLSWTDIIINLNKYIDSYVNNRYGLSSAWRHKNKTELKDLPYRTADTSNIFQFSTNNLDINWWLEFILILLIHS